MRPRQKKKLFRSHVPHRAHTLLAGATVGRVVVTDVPHTEATSWHLLSLGGLLDPGMAYHIIACINGHPQAGRLAQVLSTLDDSIPPAVAVEHAAVLSLRGPSCFGLEAPASPGRSLPTTCTFAALSKRLDPPDFWGAL